MSLSSWSLPSFHKPERSKRGQNATLVLSSSKASRQNQANSYRLIWASSFRKEGTAARSHPTYPMGWPRCCHQLETVQACWSCSTMGLMHFPPTPHQGTTPSARCVSTRQDQEQEAWPWTKKRKKKKRSGILGIVHRVAWQILAIAFWPILGASRWSMTSPEWYQEWWTGTCSITNFFHQRREGTAKGLQSVENNTFPWRHTAFL